MIIAFAAVATTLISTTDAAVLRHAPFKTPGFIDCETTCQVSSICGSKQKYLGEEGEQVKILCKYAAQNCIQLEHARWKHSTDKDASMFCRFCDMCVGVFQLKDNNDESVDNDESAMDNDESSFTSKEGACFFPQLWTEITDSEADAKFLPPHFNADDEKHENPNPIFPGLCKLSGHPGQPKWVRNP